MIESRSKAGERLEGAQALVPPPATQLADRDSGATVESSGQDDSPARFSRISLISFLAIIALWEIVSLVAGRSSVGYQFVPGPIDVIRAYPSFGGYWPGGLGAPELSRGGEPTLWGATLGMVYNTLWSTGRVFIGYVLGCGVGILLATIISWSTIARHMFSLVAHFARMLPLLAMLPLFGLWFGNSDLGTYIFAAFAVGVVMFVVCLNAIGNVPAYYAQYSTSLGSSGATTYLTVILPAAMPQCRGGLLLSIPFSWSAVLAAEMLGKQQGLGHILNLSLTYANTNTIALAGVVVVIAAAATYFIVRRALDWLTRWSE